MNDYLGKVGGRKFLLCLLCLASTTVMCYLGHISDGVYSAVIIATIGSYIAGNVAQKSVLNSDK